MQHVDPVTVLWIILAVAATLLILGSLAFHWGNHVGYRDGRRDERAARMGRATGSGYRTLGAMWTERGAEDWQAETRPQERVRGWGEGYDDVD